MAIGPPRMKGMAKCIRRANLRKTNAGVNRAIRKCLQAHNFAGYSKTNRKSRRVRRASKRS